MSWVVLALFIVAIAVGLAGERNRRRVAIDALRNGGDAAKLKRRYPDVWDKFERERAEHERGGR